MAEQSRILRQLSFLEEMDKLKQIFRVNLIMDSTRRENDAEHSWHMAVGAMLLLEYSKFPDLNIEKVLKMVLLHDVVEIDAGDTFAYDKKGHEDKAQRERKAATRLFGLLPKDQEKEFLCLWEEFDKAVSPEALYANAIDRFMPVYQNFNTEGRQWKKHGVTKAMVLERNSVIKNVSEELWQFVAALLDEAEKRQYLCIGTDKFTQG